MAPRKRQQPRQGISTTEPVPAHVRGLSRGETLLKHYLRGETLGLLESVLAKCADCTNGFDDGRKDCGFPRCPLHPWQPYRPKV